MTGAFPLHERFHYSGDRLCVENVPLETIAQKIGTPVYVYSKAALTDYCGQFLAAFKNMRAQVCYAVKSLPNIHVIQLFGKMGAGADVVSQGEMQRALAAGIPAAKIAFAGVAKTESEIEFAIKQRIMQFSVESESELDMIARVAQRLGTDARVAFRVNPDVDAKTHAKITTGKKENKFGIDIDAVGALFHKAKSMSHIKAVGIGAHIGSQILDLPPFEDAYRVMRDKISELRQQGFSISHIDLGGGLGVPYKQGQQSVPLEKYAALVRDLFGDFDIDMVFEPGRYFTANAGALLITVHHLKKGSDKHFVLTDGGMNDLIRPTLYEAHHDILPVRLPKAQNKQICDIVGPVCESSDYLALSREMHLPAVGDLLVVTSAGAYGASMSSEYNTRALTPEVLVDGDQFTVIRRRPSFDETIRLEKSSA